MSEGRYVCASSSSLRTDLILGNYISLIWAYVFRYKAHILLVSCLASFFLPPRLVILSMLRSRPVKGALSRAREIIIRHLVVSKNIERLLWRTNHLCLQLVIVPRTHIS